MFNPAWVIQTELDFNNSNCGARFTMMACSEPVRSAPDRPDDPRKAPVASLYAWLCPFCRKAHSEILQANPSFVYTKGAEPTVLEFYKMITQGAGNKISKIELVDLSAEDAKRAEKI